MKKKPAKNITFFTRSSFLETALKVFSQKLPLAIFSFPTTPDSPSTHETFELALNMAYFRKEESGKLVPDGLKKISFKENYIIEGIKFEELTLHFDDFYQKFFYLLNKFFPQRKPHQLSVIAINEIPFITFYSINSIDLTKDKIKLLENAVGSLFKDHCIEKQILRQLTNEEIEAIPSQRKDSLCKELDKSLRNLFSNMTDDTKLIFNYLIGAGFFIAYCKINPEMAEERELESIKEIAIKKLVAKLCLKITIPREFSHIEKIFFYKLIEEKIRATFKEIPVYDLNCYYKWIALLLISKITELSERKPTSFKNPKDEFYELFLSEFYMKELLNSFLLNKLIKNKENIIDSVLQTYNEIQRNSVVKFSVNNRTLLLLVILLMLLIIQNSSETLTKYMPFLILLFTAATAYLKFNGIYASHNMPVKFRIMRSLMNLNFFQGWQIIPIEESLLEIITASKTSQGIMSSNMSFDKVVGSDTHLPNSRIESINQLLLYLTSSTPIGRKKASAGKTIPQKQSTGCLSSTHSDEVIHWLHPAINTSSEYVKPVNNAEHLWLLDNLDTLKNNPPDKTGIGNPIKDIYYDDLFSLRNSPIKHNKGTCLRFIKGYKKGTFQCTSQFHPEPLNVQTLYEIKVKSTISLDRLICVVITLDGRNQLAIPVYYLPEGLHGTNESFIQNKHQFDLDRVLPDEILEKMRCSSLSPKPREFSRQIASG